MQQRTDPSPGTGLLPVEIHYKPKKNSSGRVRDGKIVLYISSRLSEAERREHIHSLVRRLEAHYRKPKPPPLELPPGTIWNDAELTQRTAEINAKYYGFTYDSIRFKRQTSRWGSCSPATQRLYISERLRGGPDELLDYLIVHELCHLRYRGHGPRFWGLVARGCPDYLARRQRLHAWGRRFD